MLLCVIFVWCEREEPGDVLLLVVARCWERREEEGNLALAIGERSAGEGMGVGWCEKIRGQHGGVNGRAKCRPALSFCCPW